jgi:hypothetical protein
LKLCNLSLENFHGPFIEAVMKTDSKHGEAYDICENPYALLRHISESSRFDHKLIKMQMAQIDSLIEPELHETLRLLAEHLFKLWIISTECVKNYEMYLDRET